jgi:hypothetical protein
LADIPRGSLARAAGFDSVVLTALKETEQALTIYGSALEYRQSLAEAQAKAHKAFEMAHDQFLAGSVSDLDLLSAERALVAADAAVAHRTPRWFRTRLQSSRRSAAAGATQSRFRPLSEPIPCLHDARHVSSNSEYSSICRLSPMTRSKSRPNAASTGSATGFTCFST